MIAALFAAAAVAAAAPLPMDPAAVKAIEAVAYDYVDGQLEGDAARVARALHPDLAKRAVTTDPDETLALRRMSKDELVDLTEAGRAEDAQGPVEPLGARPRHRRQRRRGAGRDALVRRLLPPRPLRRPLGDRQRALVPEAEGR